MKLLDKLSINRAKVLERKLEIDQGATLASRVDKLRELAASEQTNLEKYRTETTAQIEQEIKDAIAKRDGILAAATAAEERRIQAQKPVDQRIGEITEREEQVRKDKDDLKKREDILALRHIEAQRLHDIATEATVKAGEAVSGANKLFEQAEEAVARATITLNAAAKAKSDSDLYVGQATDELLRREAEIAIRERSATLVTEAQAREQQRLSLLERAIIDREGQLDREINRNK